MSYLWPDTKFNSKADGGCFELIGATAIEL